MVEWTDDERKAIEKVWKNIDIDVFGPLALQRSDFNQNKIT